MTMPYKYLRFALAQLEHARTQLNKALDLAQAQGYSSNWLAAISRACGLNDETDRQVHNIITNIRSPQYEQLAEAFQKEN